MYPSSDFTQATLGRGKLLTQGGLKSFFDSICLKRSSSTRKQRALPLRVKAPKHPSTSTSMPNSALDTPRGESLKGNMEITTTEEHVRQAFYPIETGFWTHRVPHHLAIHRVEKK